MTKIYISSVAYEIYYKKNMEYGRNNLVEVDKVVEVWTEDV